MENINVSVRFRPLNKREKNEDVCLQCKDKEVKIQAENTSSNFYFDNVFDETSKQEEIFNKVAFPAVKSACEGYNSTIFVYGSTSSGKSYTMFGSENEAGIIPRACSSLFEIIDKNEEVIEAVIKCSFVELYLEHFKDLLVRDEKGEKGGKGEKKELKLREDNIKGIYIQNVLEKYVYSPQEILDTIQEGSYKRTVSSTALNSVSSRSHAVLTLFVYQKYTDGTETTSKMHLIDLAGSENVGKSEVQGINLVEAQMINKSLSSLGNVINALTDKERSHIPYRDSKLTFLLQDSLGGNAKTVLIATCSKSVLSYSETLNTLKFAKRAKDIKNKPVVNKNESKEILLKTIEELKERILELESGLNLEKKVMEVVNSSNPETSKELTFYKTRCSLLEKKMEDLKNLQTQKQLEDILQKQRDLTEKISEKLFEEQLKNFRIQKRIEILEFFFETVRGAPKEIIKDTIEQVTTLLEKINGE